MGGRRSSVCQDRASKENKLGLVIWKQKNRISRCGARCFLWPIEASTLRAVFHGISLGHGLLGFGHVRNSIYHSRSSVPQNSSQRTGAPFDVGLQRWHIGRRHVRRHTPGSLRNRRRALLALYIRTLRHWCWVFHTSGRREVSAPYAG